MKRSIEMAEVAECDVQACVYNKETRCHALAITVGDAHGHLCDTMLRSHEHTHRDDVSGVGACKVKGCAHNEDYECQAEAIEIGMSGTKAECLTYSQR